ncbi:MAG TPA: hypothetical protein VMT53_12320 [Terriglobales bacterium]|nr:hypothetical protein [Terriglobales bacterium]
MRNNEATVTHMCRAFALLLLGLSVSTAAQNPKSVTFLRLGQQIVEQRLQTPAPSEGWSAVLRKQYQKSGIQPNQLSQLSVAGASEPMLICTLKGRGDSAIVVSASLEVPPTEGKRSVAWASLAMLPLLAESMNSASTDSSIVLIAFPPDKHRVSSSRRYVESLSTSQRDKIKAVVEISGVGRGASSYDVKPQDRYLADWLVVAAASLRQGAPAKSEYFDTEKFADARAFRSANVSAITVSSTPQRLASAWNWPGVAVEAIDTSAYYTTYQELCVFLIDIDRATRGESPRTSVAVASSSDRLVPKAPQFTDEQASTMIVRQIGEARDQYHAGTLRLAIVPELHDLVCQMSRNNQLDAALFEELLKKKNLNGTVVVASSDYPNLAPEQLQGLKVARYHSLSVSSCVVPSDGEHPSIYWIAAVAY